MLPHTDLATDRKIRTPFTYKGPQRTKIAKFFNDTNQKIDFKTNNAIYRHVKIRDHISPL